MCFDLGVYTDVSMYNEWINEVISNQTLPKYEYSPFQMQPVGTLDNEEHKNHDDDIEDDDDDDDDTDYEFDDHINNAVKHNIHIIFIIFSLILIFQSH